VVPKDAYALFTVAFFLVGRASMSAAAK